MIYKDYYQANREKILKQKKEYHAKNREKRLAQMREWRKNNKEYILQYNAERLDDVRPLDTKREAKRRARKLQATPLWLNEDDDFMFNEIYEMAKIRTEDTGVQHHVDHIVPLQGKNVSGLHVWWNLQLLPATENLRKSNSVGGY